MPLRLWRWLGLSILATLPLGGCGVEPFTEVVLTVDLQPRTREATEALEVRVWDDSRTEVVLEQSVAAPDGPLTLPLYPQGGDASRSFLVEVTALDVLGDLVAVGRAEGSYLAGQRVAALLCLSDDCLGESCGRPGPCEAGTCASCGGDGECGPASVDVVPLGTALACPAPSCVPSATAEQRCADGIDDDCDGAIDCEDEACEGTPCERPGFTCQSGQCLCSTAEICDNGVSDDCDDAVDCADDDCQGQVCDAATGLRCIGPACIACEGGSIEICDNGVDDNCDGMVDCRDPTCCRDRRCDGQRCDVGDYHMCCGGSCERIDQPERCGGCNIQCPIRTGSESRRSCFAYIADPEQPEPTWLCKCTQEQGCPNAMLCDRRFDRLRCGCRRDSDCGPGLECRITGPDRQNWCRPYPL